MKNILNLIKEKQAVYSCSPFFDFLRNTTIPPEKRLAFVPSSAPFILGFADLCKYVLRQEPTNDRVQAILNQHTYEDGEHWLWFLEDVESLGFNYSLQLNDALEFLWSEETKVSRLLTYQLYQYIAQSDAVEKLVILETIEAIADVFLSTTKQVTDELEQITNREYKYFGNCHCHAESDHEAHSEDVHTFIENLQLSEQNEKRSIDLVHQIYKLFHQWNDELLVYAQSYPASQPLVLQSTQELLDRSAYKLAS